MFCLVLYLFYFYFSSYALKVVENLNLRELFRNETQKNLKMEKGTVFFHYNRKLCVNKIMTFLKDIGKSNITDDLVSKSTNGDQTACRFFNILLTAVFYASSL